MKHIVGQHHIIELEGCNPEILKKVETIEAALLESAKKSGATILSQFFHQFAPNGASGVIVISESHFSIHTWPEQKYAAVDIFTCSNNINVDVAIAVLEEKLEASNINRHSFARGH